MGRIRGQKGTVPLAEAPSVRRDEIFRATGSGLERLQTGKLRSGGQFNRIDELPYSRITSMNFEERVMRRGSKPLSVVGLVLLLFGLGVPAVTSLVSMIPLQSQAARIGGLTNELALPGIAIVTLGVYLVASKFPRKASEVWWQVKGEDLTAEDLRGWQIAGDHNGVDELVRVVREGVSRAKRPFPNPNPTP
jgi:hypothetical protein